MDQNELNKKIKSIKIPIYNVFQTDKVWDCHPKHFFVNELGEKISLKTLPNRTFFIKGTKCYYCNLEANFFMIRQNRHNDKFTYSLNLFAEKIFNGKKRLVIFTQDHIVPISKGGSRKNINNLVTSCSPCNVKKGNK